MSSTQTDGIVLMKFWASWCSPCKALAPVLESVLKKFGDVRCESVNVDIDPNQAAVLNVRTIPTLVMIKDGEQVGRLTGMHSKEEIETFLSSHR
jgi:thioredoxin 1